MKEVMHQTKQNADVRLRSLPTPCRPLQSHRTHRLPHSLPYALSGNLPQLLSQNHSSTVRMLEDRIRVLEEERAQAGIQAERQKTDSKLENESMRKSHAAVLEQVQRTLRDEQDQMRKDLDDRLKRSDGERERAQGLLAEVRLENSSLSQRVS